MKTKVMRFKTLDDYQCFAACDDAILIGGFISTMPSEDFDDAKFSILRFPPEGDELGKIEFEAIWNSDAMKWRNMWDPEITDDENGEEPRDARQLISEARQIYDGLKEFCDQL